MSFLTQAQLKELEVIESMMKTNPAEFRQEFGMNRQEFKQYSREHSKMAEAIKKMTPTQIQVCEKLIKQERTLSEKQFEKLIISTHSCVNAALNELIENWTRDDADDFWREVNKMLDEHMEMSNKNETMSKGEMDIMVGSVRDLVFEMLEKGKTAKDIKADMKMKFPKMSGAQIKNAFAEYKEEWSEEKSAVNEIVNIIDEPKKVVKKKQVTITPEAAVQLDNIAKELSEEAKDLKETLSKDIEVKVVEPVKVENSITKQLESKLDNFEVEKIKLESDIDSCKMRIEELKKCIEEKSVNITDINIKADNVKQMIELAKTIE